VPATPCELTCYQFINYSQRGGGRPWTFRRSETELLLSLSGRLSVSTMAGVREAVLAGISAAIAYEWTFAPELKSDQVKIVLTDWRLPPCELWALIPAGRMARIKNARVHQLRQRNACKCEHDDDASSIQELLLVILTRCRNVVRDVAEVDSGNLPHCAARSARSIPFRRPP
jgi:hypothetical protein